jgi:hypothetical protein
LAGDLLESGNDPRETTVPQIDLLLFPALAAIAKHNPRAVDVDVFGTQSGQPEGSIGTRVLLVPDAHERLLEKSYGGRQHALSRDTRPGEVRLDARADARKSLHEVGQAAVLGLVPDRPPSLVVPVLLSPASVAPGGLDVSERARRDPDVLPRRRDGQAAEAAELRLVADAPTVRLVNEAAAFSDAPYARPSSLV